MKKINTIDLSRTEWENLIDEYILGRNAEMRRLTSSLLYTSTKYHITPITLKNYVLRYLIFAVRFMQARKTSKNATYILICLTNLIKGDKIILPLINIARVFIDFDLAKLTTLYRVVFLFQKIFKKV